MALSDRIRSEADQAARSGQFPESLNAIADDVGAIEIELEGFYRETVADHMRRAGWTGRQIGAAMDAKGATS